MIRTIRENQIIKATQSINAGRVFADSARTFANLISHDKRLVAVHETYRIGNPDRIFNRDRRREKAAINYLNQQK